VTGTATSAGPVTAGAPAIDHRALLASAEGLGALPLTVTRLASLISDPDHHVSDLVEVASFDQSLTANLLRRANSAALAARVPVKTVREAAVRLGSGALLSMALATTVSTKMHRPLPAYGLAEGQLWQQSVAALLAAEAVRAEAAVEVPAEAPTAALLHDFGKVVLSHHFGPQVLEMLRHAAEVDGMGLLEAEEAVFGVNHADIGALVAQQWKLPHSIVDAIVHHHSTDPALMPMNAAVSLAHAMVPDVLAEVSGVPREEGVPVFESHFRVMEALGIDPRGYPALLATAQKRYTELADRYRVA
jgi:putative nucleotidyltransferase with HDIG domain